jgi:hypothetical protein
MVVIDKRVLGAFLDGTDELSPLGGEDKNIDVGIFHMNDIPRLVLSTGTHLIDKVIRIELLASSPHA